MIISKRTIALVISLIMLLSLAVACTSAPGTPSVSSGGSSPAASPSGGGASPAAPSQSAAAPPSPSSTMAEPPPTNPEVKFAEHIELILDGTTIGVLNFNSPAGSGPSPNNLQKVVYDTLLNEALNEDGSAWIAVPMLAKSWESDDFQRYIFHLRDDVVFHNGDKFTAEDVVFTCIYSRDNPGSQANNFWQYVTDITALDDYTLQIDLRAVMPDYPDIVTSHFTGILNKRAIDADPEKGIWIGTGAFKVVEFQPNDYVILERNDNYWEAPVPTKSMAWRFVPEASARTIMLQNGTSDICLGISETDMDMFDADPNFEVHSLTHNFPNGIHFNMEDPIMADKNFRYAVLYAIDREEITLAAQGAWGVVETEGTVWGYRTRFRNRALPFIEQDLDKAKAYLAASIYNGEVLELVTANANNVRGSEVLQNQLSRIGINTEINQMDTPGFSAYTLDGDTQLIFWSAQLNTSISGVRSAFYPGIANNRARYNNPEVNEMLDRGLTMTDEVAREALYLRVQEIIADDLPVINVFYRVTTAVAADGVGGVTLTPSVTDLRYLYKVID